jgi:hypothetical protein
LPAFFTFMTYATRFNGRALAEPVAVRGRIEIFEDAAIGRKTVRRPVRDIPCDGLRL